MGALGFCKVKQNESDIHFKHEKVYHFQHQAFADKKNHNPTINNPESDQASFKNHCMKVLISACRTSSNVKSTRYCFCLYTGTSRL